MPVSVSANVKLEKPVAGRAAELLQIINDLEIEITERKKVEDELRISEMRMRRFLELTKAIPWEADATTRRFTYVGPEAAKLLGYPAEMWLEDSFWADHIHPNDRQWVMEFCENSTKKQDFYELEYRMIGNADQVVWIQDMVSVVRQDNKSSILQGFMVDITARKSAELELRESEMRYRTITESTSDAIFVSDGAGKIVFANSTAKDQFAAKSMDQLIGRQMIETVHPNDRNDVKSRRRRVLSQGWHPPFAERTRLRLDGTEFKCESHGVPIPWGGETAVLIVIRDITQRKRTEEILQNLSARLISAHEDERSRIARELHDDISQSLAVLSVEMELYQMGESKSQNSVADFLAIQVQRVKDLSSKLQALSRRLHPSIIEHIGLVSAVSGYCKELSVRPDFRVKFIHEGVRVTTDNEISLCLFRVVQEGLRNVINHSGAKLARVELIGNPEEIILRISDWGKGFDPGSDEFRRGLGLLSMRERLRIVGGVISFSQLEPSGFQIEARVPFSGTTRS